MPLFLLSPVLLALISPYLLPDTAAAISNIFPQAVYLMLALTAILVVLMRQWHWLFSLSLLGSHYLALQQALLQPLSHPDVMALSLFLPLLFTGIMLLLQLQTKRQLFSLPGLFLLVLCLLAPVAMLWLPLAQWLVALQIPATLMHPVVSHLPLSWLQLWWMAVIASCWLGLLNFYAAGSQRWGQFAAWLAIMLLYLLLHQAYMVHWLTLAASITLLLSLTRQMLQLAYIDELTQLPQRRALLSRLTRLGRRSAITMLDVDHFKKFNDTYGHDVGDQVLKLLGAVLGSERGLTAYRYGGEEFTLVFSHNNLATLAAKLEQVRAKVADYPLNIRQQGRPRDTKQGKHQRGSANAGKTVHVTISLGCAIRKPGETTEQLLKRADQALYKAKKAGRNQVAFAT
jgi:diguanylate cyclase (GGDEF)-like protein